MVKKLKKYKITYRYNMIGWHNIEAKNINEAIEKHFEFDYGDDEEVIMGSHRVIKAKLVKK